VEAWPGRAADQLDVVTCGDTARWGQGEGEGAETTACMILLICKLECIEKIKHKQTKRRAAQDNKVLYLFITVISVELPNKHMRNQLRTPRTTRSPSA
jgi:hypothetical protein